LVSEANALGNIDGAGMTVKSLFAATFLALCCVATSAYCASDPPTAGTAAAVGTISEQKLAAITPGTTTKAQVQALLGAPWRSIRYTDMDQIEDEIWEYRGEDASGGYRIHIEFDSHDIVHVIGKIPDKVSGGNGTIMRTAPAPSGGSGSSAPHQ
jgi:hypothetical protein